MKSRNGFTLIELLIVIAIMAVLATLAVVSYNGLSTKDRMTSSAGQVKSSLAGARDRAIYGASRRKGEAAVHGLRFLPHPTIPGAFASMQFVEIPAPWTTGAVTLGRPDVDNDNNADSDVVRTLRGTGTAWYNLYLQGLLKNGSRIRLPANGSWYTVDTSQLGPTNEVLLLSTDYRDQSGFAAMPAVVALILPDYRLELQPVPSPGEQPMQFASGVVIDAAQSLALPPHTPGEHFDILFTSRGGCVGNVTAVGMVHFLLSDVRDVTLASNPAVAQHGNHAVTLFTQSGAVETHPVDPTDANSDGIADNPFRYAVP